MSKGNPKVVVRFTAETLAKIGEAVNRANERTREAPLTVSDWIRRLVENKLRDLDAPRRLAKNAGCRCGRCGVKLARKNFVELELTSVGQNRLLCLPCYEQVEAEKRPPLIDPK